MKEVLVLLQAIKNNITIYQVLEIMIEYLLQIKIKLIGFNYAKIPKKWSKFKKIIIQLKNKNNSLKNYQVQRVEI